MSEPTQIQVIEKWPKVVRIEPGKSLKLDGVEFPWYITHEGVAVNVGNRCELTTVTVTIPCDEVMVEDVDRTIETYEEWKQRRGITDRDERMFLQGSKTRV